MWVGPSLPSCPRPPSLFPRTRYRYSATEPFPVLPRRLHPATCSGAARGSDEIHPGCPAVTITMLPPAPPVAPAACRSKPSSPTRLPWLRAVMIPRSIREGGATSENASQLPPAVTHPADDRAERWGERDARRRDKAARELPPADGRVEGGSPPRRARTRPVPPSERGLIERAQPRGARSRPYRSGGTRSSGES